MSEEGSERGPSSEALVDPALAERVRRRIEGYRAAMVAFQTGLTAIPGVGPDSGGEGEARRGAFLDEQARTMGFKLIERHDALDDRVPSGFRPNLLIRLPGRRPRPRVLVLAHVDTVPPGEPRLWHSDPFQVVERDGKLYGRGVEDDQQGLTSGLFALKALLDERSVPTTDVVLALVADEEAGNQFGVEHLLAAVPDLVELGRQVHASMPHEGVNAHRAAAHLVVRLDTRGACSGGGTAAGLGPGDDAGRDRRRDGGAVFRRRGIPAVAWSTNDDMAHQPDEYCVVDNLVADAVVLALLFLRGTGAASAP